MSNEVTVNISHCACSDNRQFYLIPFTAIYSTCIQKYEVEAIINERSTDGKQEYLVRWAGNYKPSWQPANILEKTVLTWCKSFVT